MKTYRHYSFDLWMTLIRSNPSFKPERVKYFHDKFNPDHKSPEAVTAIFKQVDLLAGAINEKTGKQISAEEMYLWVIGLLANVDQEEVIREVDVLSLYEDMETLVMDYPPQLYDDGTLILLEKLKERSEGAGFSLLSNTAFIKGRTLRKVSYHTGLAGFFDFELYSDELGMSKPNVALFQLVLEKAARTKESLTAAEVVHIGDNPLCDLAGSMAAGMDGILVHSNHQQLSNLL